MSTSKHLAAIAPEKGARLLLTTRTTPNPGPTEVLIRVRAIALNPVDHYQRDKGFPPLPRYPAILGCDVAGTVISIGANVPSSLVAAGDRVLALATGFFCDYSLDHGAFQECVLAPVEAVTPLPGRYSFAEGAMMPLAASTALSGWTSVGIPVDARFEASAKEAVLIWGASSSVGTVAVQSAKSMGYVVYAVAGAANLEYVQGLGADAVFDHKDDAVIAKIVERAKEDGVRLRTAQAIVVGALQPVLDVLEQTRAGEAVKVVSAPPLEHDGPTIEGAEIKFSCPPLDGVERTEHYRKIFNVWLKDGLAAGAVVLSPKLRVIEGGLEELNGALDVLSAGVSATKIVVTL